MANLEQLMGSQTFFGTISISVVLRRIALLPIVLMCVWAFSPLGSQASLRAIGTEPRSGIGSRQLMYLSTTEDDGSTIFQGADEVESTISTVKSIYASALLQSTAGLQSSNGSSKNFDSFLSGLGAVDDILRSSTADAWSNVRIPKLEVLPGYDPTHAEAPIPVPYGSQIINYSSLIGIPVREVERDQQAISSVGNLSFPLKSRYMSLKVCARTFFHPNELLRPDSVTTGQS